jgi:hypothetical protein
MKKYRVEQKIVFVESEHRDEITSVYECNAIECAKNWTGECTRITEANSLKISKTGKEIRKELSRGQYITVGMLYTWKSNSVIVYDNETSEVVYSNN